MIDSLQERTTNTIIREIILLLKTDGRYTSFLSNVLVTIYRYLTRRIKGMLV